MLLQMTVEHLSLCGDISSFLWMVDEVGSPGSITLPLEGRITFEARFQCSDEDKLNIQNSDEVDKLCVEIALAPDYGTP